MPCAAEFRPSRSACSQERRGRSIAGMQNIVEKLRADPVLGRYASKLVYVLSGGAARGFCHLGMIERLEKSGIRPDLVVGTSAGALFGALYCHFGGIDGACARVEEVLASDEFRAFNRKYFGGSSRTGDPVRGKMMAFFAGLAGTLKSSIRLGKAVVTTSMVTQKDAHVLFQRIFDGITFASLKIPFAAVAVDLATGCPAVFSDLRNDRAAGSGRLPSEQVSLVKAVMASSAIPLIFPAVQIDGRPHVDGYIMANLPVREAGALLPGEQVLLAGFDVSAPVGPMQEDPSPVDLARRLIELATRSRQSADNTLADVLFQPVDRQYHWSSFSEYRQLFDLGAAYMSAERSAMLSAVFLSRCQAAVLGEPSFARRIRASARLRRVLKDCRS
jgi:NTE family protein